MKSFQVLCSIDEHTDNKITEIIKTLTAENDNRNDSLIKTLDDLAYKIRQHIYTERAFETGYNADKAAREQKEKRLE